MYMWASSLCGNWHTTLSRIKERKTSLIFLASAQSRSSLDFFISMESYELWGTGLRGFCHSKVSSRLGYFCGFVDPALLSVYWHLASIFYPTPLLNHVTCRTHFKRGHKIYPFCWTLFSSFQHPLMMIIEDSAAWVTVWHYPRINLFILHSD